MNQYGQKTVHKLCLTAHFFYNLDFPHAKCDLPILYFLDQNIIEIFALPKPFPIDFYNFISAEFHNSGGVAGRSTRSSMRLSYSTTENTYINLFYTRKYITTPGVG